LLIVAAALTATTQPHLYTPSSSSNSRPRPRPRACTHKGTSKSNQGGRPGKCPVSRLAGQCCGAKRTLGQYRSKSARPFAIEQQGGLPHCTRDSSRADTVYLAQGWAIITKTAPFATLLTPARGRPHHSHTVPFPVLASARTTPPTSSGGPPCPCRCRASSWASPPHSHPQPHPHPLPHPPPPPPPPPRISGERPRRRGRGFLRVTIHNWRGGGASVRARSCVDRGQ
jgi:hypothetical protein